MDQSANETYYGRLIVQTTSARNAVPVSGATVVVRKLNEDGTSQLLTVMNTDADGLTEPYEIETPSPSESLTPGGAVPYTDITIEISADGYYGIVNTHVPIYPGITSLQPGMADPRQRIRNAVSLRQHHHQRRKQETKSLKKEQTLCHIR